MAPVRKNRVLQKCRKWNWDVHETLSLLSAYDSEKKNFLQGTNLEKRAVWKKIADQLYPNDAPFRRTHSEVQKKWRNMCTALRHEMQRNKKKHSKGELLLSPILSKVADIITEEDKLRKIYSPSYVARSSHHKKPNNEVPSKTTTAIRKTAITNSSLLFSTPTNDITKIATSKESILSLPSTPAAVSIPDSILPTTVANDDDLHIETNIPFIKDEPLSPVPCSDVQKTDRVPLQIAPKVTQEVTKTTPQIITFGTPPLTNTTSGPQPLRIISIVNPLSPSGHQSHATNVPPKLILKPINSLTSVPKVPSSSVVVLGPPKLTSPPPRLPLSSQPSTAALSLSTPLINQQANKQPMPPLPLLFTRKPEEIKITDPEILKVEVEKLAIAQEQLKIEKEKLKIEKEKIEIERQKIQHAKDLFQNEKSCKRTLLEDKKIILENKKLKTEIKKLALESELLALQVKKHQSESQSS